MSKKPWPAASIEMVKTGDLKPYAQNAKEHTPEQIEQLGKSYDEFGWTNPVLVDEKGEIIAGHGRVMMALSKGLPEVPVMRAKGWTQAQKRAYRIFDNRSAELSLWNQPMLQAELRELTKLPAAQLKPLGYSSLQVAQILDPPPASTGSRTPNPVIQTNIVFDTAEQQQTWFSFIRKLKAQYPDQTTVAGKLNEFLKEQLGNG